MPKSLRLLCIYLIVLLHLQDSLAQDTAVINSPEVGAVVWFPLHAEKKKVVAIKIPDDFKQLKTASGSYKYVPRDDIEYFGWTEDIKIFAYVDKKFTAEELINTFIQVTSNYINDFEVVDASNQYEGDINIAKAILSYPHKSSIEGVKAISGPDVCVKIQYEVKVDENDPKDEARALAKIEQFFAKDIKITKVGDKSH